MYYDYIEDSLISIRNVQGFVDPGVFNAIGDVVWKVDRRRRKRQKFQPLWYPIWKS